MLKISFGFFLFLNLSFAATDFSKVEFKFLSKEDSANYLIKQDEYLDNVSILDLSLIQSTSSTISLKDHLAFLQTTTLDWQEVEKKQIQNYIDKFIEITNRLNLNLKLPTEIYLLKTNGEDQFNSHYTKNQAIIFPANNEKLFSTDAKTFYHEMFHVLSRYNKADQNDIYEICNFKALSSKINFNEILEEIRITNPDAPIYEHSITLNVKDKTVEAIPFMYSAIKQSEIKGKVKEPEIYRLGMLDLATIKDANPKLYKTSETNYKEKAEVNGHYYIHPEEIMAENFKYLYQLYSEEIKESDIKNLNPIYKLKKYLQK